MSTTQTYKRLISGLTLYPVRRESHCVWLRGSRTPHEWVWVKLTSSGETRVTLSSTGLTLPDSTQQLSGVKFTSAQHAESTRFPRHPLQWHQQTGWTVTHPPTEPEVKMVSECGVHLRFEHVWADNAATILLHTAPGIFTALCPPQLEWLMHALEYQKSLEIKNEFSGAVALRTAGHDIHLRSTSLTLTPTRSRLARLRRLLWSVPQ